MNQLSKELKDDLRTLSRLMDSPSPDPTHMFCPDCDEWYPIEAVCEHLAKLFGMMDRVRAFDKERKK